MPRSQSGSEDLAAHFRPREEIACLAVNAGWAVVFGESSERARWTCPDCVGPGSCPSYRPARPPLEGLHIDGVRVLVVEDMPDAREMLCEFLGLFGATCWACEDVPTARAMLTEILPDVPDVVISDIGLPGEDGYSLLRWLLARPSPPPTPPVIAVSAVAQLGAQAAGFEAHIPKPIDMPCLLRAIVNAMKKRASER